MIQDDPPLRLGIWAAVSSKEQAADDKNSLEAQEQAGRLFAMENSAEIVRVYRIPGHSRDLVLWEEAESTMPAYRQLRQDLEQQRIDLLWALDVDRLGRDPALSSQVLSLAERHGAEVYLSTAPHQLGHQTIGHRYVTAIQAVRAKEDQARRVSHWRVGMEHRARRGLPIRFPYGYRPIRDAHAGTVTGAEFDPDQLGALRLITRLFLAGQSYNQIARALNRSPHRPARSDRWRISTVRDICLNDAYAGIVKWRGLRQPSELYPALWDPATHRAIENERRRRTHTRTKRTGSPVSKIARCARCGSSMHSTGKRGRRVLRCGRHAVKARTGITCHPNHIHEELVVQAVAEFLDALTPAAITASVARADPGAELRAELEDLQRTITRLKGQRRRIALDRAEGIMRAGAYRLADDNILARLEHAEARARAIQEELAELPDPTQRRVLLEELAENFPGYLATRPPNEIVALLQRAGLTAWIEKGDVQLVAITGI